jgi:hypothetical protein
MLHEQIKQVNELIDLAELVVLEAEIKLKEAKQEVAKLNRVKAKLEKTQEEIGGLFESSVSV